MLSPQKCKNLEADVKAIIFDIGGVIQGLDWSPVVNSLLDLKEDLDVETYKSALYYKRFSWFDLYTAGKIGSDVYWAKVADVLGVDKKYIYRLSQSFGLLYSFVNFELLSLIETLRKNYKTYVLSNACAEIEGKVIKDNIYIHLFDKLYFSHNIGWRKPSKEAYLFVAKDGNLKPEECLFVDNDIQNIKGACAVGMKCLLFKGVDVLKYELYEVLNKAKNIPST